MQTTEDRPIMRLTSFADTPGSAGIETLSVADIDAQGHVILRDILDDLCREGQGYYDNSNPEIGFHSIYVTDRPEAVRAQVAALPA